MEDRLSPALGRFVQADSLVPQPGNPLAWDRYAYAGNNPANYIDPTGHAFECGLTGEDHCGSGYGPQQPMLIVQAPEDALDNVWAGAELVASVLYEPADWVITGAHCLQGDCSPYVLLGLLPFIPGAAARYLDDFSFWLSKNPNQIGIWGELRVGEELPITIKQQRVRDPISGASRIYDGSFASDPRSYVEVKTSTRGTIYATREIKNQITFDANYGTLSGKYPTWIFVGAKPSRPMITLLQQNRIPWLQLHIPK